MAPRPLSGESGMQQKPDVVEWYANQHVFVTGATGFMGKILVEKLLRTCPDISAIYLMVRTKRGREPHQRLEDFINTPVFDKIRDSPEGQKLFDKLHCVSGDLTANNLNLSRDDLKLLQNNVTTVFHMAANVRFDQPLRPAVILNTEGTLRILDVAETFQKLKVFVHVSTSYCHCDETALEERTYQAPHDPRKMVDLVSWMDPELLTLLTPKLLKNSPNTYSYTKCLTEQLVAEYKDKLPIVIARPSIVTSAWQEPIPGYVDNLNGPVGIMVAAGKGIIRSMHCEASLEADLVPVDVAVNSLIVTAWGRGTMPQTKDTMVVNITAGKDNPITWQEMLNISKKHFYNNPFSVCLWYPSGRLNSSYFLHMVAVFFLHTIPAYLIDFLLTIIRGKPFMVKTQKRIQNGLDVLQYYTTRPWTFYNDKMKEMRSGMNERDRKLFYTEMSQINWDQYGLDCVLGARKYCIHEEPDTLPRARKILKRLYYLDLAVQILLGGLFLWFVYSYALSIFEGIEVVVSTVFSKRTQTN